jgi:hypothetical protein
VAGLGSGMSGLQIRADNGILDGRGDLQFTHGECSWFLCADEFGVDRASCQGFVRSIS